MITIIALILVILGSLNWFAVGAFNFNIINWIFGANAYLGARIVYCIVGVAGMWLIYYLIRCGKQIFNNPGEVRACKRAERGYGCEPGDKACDCTANSGSCECGEDFDSRNNKKK